MRRMGRFVLGFLVLAGIGLGSPRELVRSSPGLAVNVASADTSANDCVGFEKRDAEKGIEYSIKNECEKKLSCSVSWKVVCEDAHGKVTQSKSANERFRVAESDEHTFVASASECKVDWRIDGVSWSCDEAR